MTGIRFSNMTAKSFLMKINAFCGFWLLLACGVFILIAQSQPIFANNTPKVCTELGDSSLGAAGRSDLYWSKNTLRVSFLDGADFQKQKVRLFAPEWSKYANIKFEFVENGASDIRISFESGGSWSYVGTSAEKHINQTTMNFGWFDEKTTDEEFKRVVWHEFGHALGLVHEHQSPAAAIKWNKPVVIKYYKDTFGWNENSVQKSIFDKYSEEQVNHTDYDPASIMHYHIEAGWTTDSSSVPWNTKLSDMDKSFIKKVYP
jgi:hypothetical protein